jgi:hypothetical protein
MRQNKEWSLNQRSLTLVHRVSHRIREASYRVTRRRLNGGKVQEGNRIPAQRYFQGKTPATHGGRDRKTNHAIQRFKRD